MEAELEKFLDDEINLTQSQISQGSKSHTYIRDLLGNKSDNDESFPWLIEGNFLSGSYARGTKLHPLDDIDVMIVLDGTGLVPLGMESTHGVRNNEGGENGPIHNHIGEDHLLNSISVLDTFHKGLSDSYPDSKIKKHGQAVNVWLESYGLGIDIVPCFHIVPIDENQQDFYYIPLGNGNPGWLKTNPKLDEKISNELHNRHNKKIKSIVKLLKYWNREKNADKIRSYHLETIVWYVFHKHPFNINSLQEGIEYFFNYAKPYLENSLDEITGFGAKVDKYMSSEDRALSILALDSARSALQSAGLLNPITGWKKVFGDNFGN